MDSIPKPLLKFSYDINYNIFIYIFQLISITPLDKNNFYKGYT